LRESKETILGVYLRERSELCGKSELIINARYAGMRLKHLLILSGMKISQNGVQDANGK
jgi:hypothetical protein